MKFYAINQLITIISKFLAAVFIFSFPKNFAQHLTITPTLVSSQDIVKIQKYTKYWILLTIKLFLPELLSSQKINLVIPISITQTTNSERLIIQSIQINYSLLKNLLDSCHFNLLFIKYSWFFCDFISLNLLISYFLLLR